MQESVPSPSHAELAERLTSLPLFNSLDAATLHDVITEVTWLRLNAGDVLFRQGEQDDSLCVVLEGRLQSMVNEADGSPDITAELSQGSSVGEMSLLTGLPRSVTVTVLEDCALVRLTRAGFDRLAERNPAAMEAFATTILPRVQQNLLGRALTSVFEGLSAEARDQLCSELEWQHLRSGESLFEEGDPSDDLFILVNGRLMMTASDAEGGSVFVGEISRGESIGDLGLLTGDPRPATAYAVRDTDLVRLSRTAFERLVTRYPMTMMQLIRPIVRRSRPRVGAVAIKADTVSAFAVLPVGPNVPLEEFASNLAATLERFGPTLYLSSERLDSMIGKLGISQTAPEDPTELMVVSWLSEQETRYKYIVYQGDREWSEWTSRCVRQTDRTLLVALADSDPGLGRIEMALEGMRSAGHKELVLLHPPTRECPSGTQAWLAPRDLVAHHHVRIEDQKHLDRLARRLTGRALGLVLGGGGARGLAHIGVIRALEEAGIDIDLVGGTSIGGLVGGGYALGMDINAMMKLAKMFGLRKHFVDYTFPMVSFFSSRKISELLHVIYGDVNIEDLWRPFFCVSSNLTQAKPMTHRQGPLWKYVRATIALPAIFTPVSDGGELLVDGAVMNNIPIDIMRTISEGGPVVAVNVSVGRDPGADYEFGTYVSGWQVLGSRLRRQPVNVPSIFGSIMRSMEVNEVHSRRAKLELADLLIAPPIAEFPILGFDAWEKIIAAGYHSAREALAEWNTNPNRTFNSLDGSVVQT